MSPVARFLEQKDVLGMGIRMRESVKLSKISLGLKLIFIGILLRMFSVIALLIPYGAILTLTAIYAEAILMLAGLWIAGKRDRRYHNVLCVYVLYYFYGQAEELLAEFLVSDVASFLYIIGKSLLEVWLVYLLCHTTEKLLLEQEEKGIAKMGKIVYLFYFIRMVFNIIYGVFSWFFTVPAILEIVILPLGLCYMVVQVIYIVFLGRSFSFLKRRAEKLEQKEVAEI